MNRRLLLRGDELDFCFSSLKGARFFAILFLFNFIVFSIEAQQVSLSPKMPDFNFGRIDKERVDYELWKAEPFGKYNPADEIIEKRDQFSKHFRQADGSIVAHIAAGPIHYWENGQWKTIFHSLSKSENGFENTTNSIKTYYPEKIGNPLLTVLPNGEQFQELNDIKLSFVAENRSVISSRNANPSAGIINQNVIYYYHLFGMNSSARISQNTFGRKLEYVFNNLNSFGSIPNNAKYVVISEQVVLPVDFTARKINNEIELVNSSGVVVAKYERPIFYDSYFQSEQTGHHHQLNSQSTNHLTEGKYEITQTGNLLFVHTVIPVNWLKNADLVYPIFIDPTFTVTPDNTSNWSGSVNVRSSSLGAGSYTSTNIHESFDGRLFLGHARGSHYSSTGNLGSTVTSSDYIVGNAWIRFNTSSVPTNICLQTITLNTFVFQGYLTDPNVCLTNVRVRHMNLDPVPATNANRLTDIRDGALYADVNFAGNNNVWRTFTLNNSTYNEMLSGMFAVGLETYNTNQNHTEHEYVLLRGYNDANRPYITLTYNNQVNGSCSGIFDYTGSDQTYTVPAGVCEVEVHLWGAGGGGGGGGSGRGGIGGGGGYVTGRLAVTAGENLIVIVGQGGRVNTATGSYGGGGAGGGHASCWAGGGGGRSAIRRGTIELVTAGGGGGGGETESTSRWGGAGGAGGAGATSPDGAHGFRGGNAANPPASYNSQGDPYAGKGGSTSGSAGGAGGASSVDGTAGSAFTGGNGARNSNNAGAGGGGGGYYGGGGGAFTNGNEPYGSGGGGGSSFIGGLVTGSATAIGGSNQTAGNAGHSFNVNLFGGGGNRNSGNTHGSPGQPGRVVIIPISSVITMGSFTLNTQANDISACVGQTITVSHSGWNNGGGTVAYWVGIEAPSIPGWVTTWSILENACQNQNSCSFVVPSLPNGTRIVVHSNGYNGCGWGPGVTRFVTVNVTSAPTGSATQTFCASSTPTIASLSATGSLIRWYAYPTGGGALPPSFGLSNGATYYASQTVSGCESASRLAVTVTINPVPVTPVIPSATICGTAPGNTVTLAPEYPTGGTVFNSDGYRAHVFTSGGTLTVPTGFSGLAEVLVVGGGGGGGGIIGGGGGAGGLQFSTVNLTPGSKTVVIGAGGIGGTGWNSPTQAGGKGGDSQFDAITAIGGGGGGYHAGSTNFWDGGSGGGGGWQAYLSALSGTGTPGQGKNGGIGGQNNGGGGGGFTEVGGVATGAQTCNPSCVGGIAAGNGGRGFFFPQFSGIAGSPTGWFAGGGGGGARTGNGTAGTGGNGGGTNGTTSTVLASSSLANTGGGGGGGGYDVNSNLQMGGNGGSGIVIVRYFIGTPTWTSDDIHVATVNSGGLVTGVNNGGTTNINYSVAGVGGCNAATVAVPITVLGGVRLAPTGPQCSGTQLNFEALPNPSVSGTTISWTVTTPSGLSASPTSGNTNLFSTTLTNSTSGTLQPTITVTHTLGSLSCARSFTPNILAPLNPTFNSFGPYCTGASAPSLPGTSNNGIAGTWSPATISTASAGSTNYTFTPSSTTNCETQAVISITINSCNNFGEFASAAFIQTCSNSNTSNSYYNTTGDVANQISPTPLQSHNFGTYIQNSGQLKLQGGEMKTWKNNPGNVCGVTLYYRVYPASSTPSGSFTAITLPWYENCNSGSFPSGGPCGGNDQKWQRPGNGNPLANVDLTTFAPDNYVLEIYYDISGSHTSNSNCDATVSVNNNGNNFTSLFSIIAPPTASNTGAYCEGQTIQLNASNGGASYAWSGPNSFTNNTQNPSISNATTAMAGTYTVSVSTANNCPVTATTNVVVNSNPNAQITGNLNFCPGGNTTLTASGGGTYLWSPGGETTASIVVSTPNTYTVTVTNNGCTGQAQATVGIHSIGVIHQITAP